jgi:hypothetical protein
MANTAGDHFFRRALPECNALSQASRCRHASEQTRLITDQRGHEAAAAVTGRWSGQSIRG